MELHETGKYLKEPEQILVGGCYPTLFIFGYYTYNETYVDEDGGIR